MSTPCEISHISITDSILDKAGHIPSTVNFLCHRSSSKMNFALFLIIFVFLGCNEVYQRLSGEISSPNYPGSYPKDASCDYFIKMDPGEQIMLKFLDLDLADPISCVDSVEIFDVNDASRGRLAKICGKREKGKLYHFHTNILRITFKSNRDIAGRGFKVSFWAKRLYPQGKA